MNGRLILLVLLALCAAPSAFAADAALIDFELEDAEEVLHARSEWNGKAVVLFLSSRESVAHNENYVWSRPIMDAIAARADADAFVSARVVDVRGLPRFVRGMARGIAADEGNPVRLVLLDWEGSFAEAYRLRGDTYYLLVFDARHQLVLSEAMQAFSAEQLAAILVRLELVNSTTMQP